jgi:arsenite methyltransferase
MDHYAKAQVDAIKTGSAPCAANCPMGEERAPRMVRDAIKLIHPDVVSSYFGCGLPCPHAVKGTKILDLGSGTGRDCFLLAYLAGEGGHVTGVDMTPLQLEKAREMIPYHAEKFGFNNVDFKEGVLEKLNEVKGLEPSSFDVIISNCVINLTKDKSVVFKHAFDLLKPGGELCFSDVYTDSPLPEEVRNNELSWNECFGGALPWNEFIETTKKIGFYEPLNISWVDYVATEDQPEIAQLTKGLKFYSVTTRLFKPNPEKTTTSKKVTYKGTIEGCEEKLTFMEKLSFKKGEPKEVDEKVSNALFGSRFSAHFEFQ